MAKLRLVSQKLGTEDLIISKKGKIRLKKGMKVTISDEMGNTTEMKFVADIKGELILQPVRKSNKSEILLAIQKYHLIKKTILGGGLLSLFSR